MATKFFITCCGLLALAAAYQLGVVGAHASPSSPSQFVAIGSDTNNQNYLAVTSDGSVHFSVDAGASWTLRAPVPAGGVPIVGLASDSNNQNYVALASNGDSYLTTDAGSSWSYRGNAGAGPTAASTATWGSLKVGQR